jgi:hypothetical protein
MGNLKPGATYIYERAGGVVYAREVGSIDRRIVGYNYDEETLKQLKKFGEMKIWEEIFEEAENNLTLQEALERVKVIYYLSKKENGSET